MTSVAGTGALIRLILRLDRIRLSVWVIVLSLVPIGTASAFQSLYDTQAAREELAATVSANPAFTALLGPLYEASTGGLTAWRVGTLGSFIAAVMAVLTVIRHTRDDEETGRRELLGSTVVGRHAPLLAALTVTVAAGVVIGSLVTGGLIGLDLPISGAVAFGAGMAGVVLAFAAVGAIAAQLTQGGSTARGLGVGITGFLFVLRMAGDAGTSNGTGWLSWLSPIGWFSRLRPFAGERWWVLALWIGFTGLVTTAAVVISSRRDIGEGLVAPRPGPDRAPASLRNTAGLAWRLQRASLLGWTVGIGLLGVVYGAAADSIGDLIAENPQLGAIFEQLGGARALIDTFFSAAIGVIALIASAYSIRSVLRLKVEEDSLRSETVLATATPRTGYAWSHLAFGLAGPAVILAVAGALAGATYGAIVGDVAGEVPRVLATAMIQLPAVWVVTGSAMALYGLAPRFSTVAWGVLIGCLILGQLGRILDFPQWSIDLSPFSHIPLVPAENFVVTPLVVLLAIAAALVAAGLIGFRMRDTPAG